MTHGAEAALPTIATIIKTQLAKIGVEVTVEVIDRPIFLRRQNRDRDWDQTLNFSGAVLDAFTVSRLIDTRAGANTPNHQDKHVDELIFIQAARANVKGYEQLNGFKVRFESMWLDR